MTDRHLHAAPESSLYRCEKCGHVVRDHPRKTTMHHVHYDENGEWLGHGADGLYTEFPDDQREGVDDLRDAIWLA